MGIRVGYTINQKSFGKMVLSILAVVGIGGFLCGGLLFNGKSITDANQKAERDRLEKAARDSGRPPVASSSPKIPPPVSPPPKPAATESRPGVKPKIATEAEQPPAAAPTVAATESAPETPDVSELARNEKRAKTKLNFAKTLLGKGKRAEAKEYLDEVLEKWPDTEAAKEAAKLRQK